MCKDSKIIPGECLVSRHRLIVLDIGLDIVLLYEIARCVNAKLET